LSFEFATVSELERRGVLLVQDGNHGANRPRGNEIVESGIPHVRAADIDSNGVIDFEGAQQVSESAYSRIKKGRAEPGDVLLTHKGTVGRVGRVPLGVRPFLCSPQTTFWRSLDASVLNQGFLHAYLRSPEFSGQLRARMNETDMAPYVSLTAQRELVLPLPPIEAQAAVAEVLRPLDERIESNRRLASRLEEITVALFKAHFIDFVGMTDLVDSEIGPIPRGWEVRALSSLGRFVNGGALTKDASGSGRLIIRIAEMKNGPGLATKYTDITVPDDQVARPGDLLFAWSGSLCVTRWTLPEAVINQHIFKCMPNPGVPGWLLEGCLKDALPEFVRIAADKATTMGHIRRGDLDSPKWAVPAPAVIEELDSVMASLLARRLGCETESCLLADLRDALVPKLVSGQIRVRDAEGMVEST
jgi:type I restriction enzyme S subunit